MLNTLIALFFTFAHASDLRTIAEISKYQKTGRYDEVLKLCGAFQISFAKQVRCVSFGMSPEGRTMKALVYSPAGHFTAAKARAAHDTILLIQGGIHAGEIDGKDAGFRWLREVLQKQIAPPNGVTVVFVPVFNVDGHERFSHNNRPNQIGPEEMGWRTTAQNLNLNRDYTKADAPEMQAMLTLLNDWDPIVYADLHVTDGAQFQHVISLNFLPNHLAVKTTSADYPSRKLIELAGELETDMSSALVDYKPLVIYPDFVKNDDPTSGFKDVMSLPRFSQGYWSSRNRIGFLVETHSWKNYRTRVNATHDAIEWLIRLASKDGPAWTKAAHDADRAFAQKAPGLDLTIRYAPSAMSHPIRFEGYEYKIVKSAVSGQTRIVYDPTKNQSWTVPLFDDLKPQTTVRLPKAGYVIESAFADDMARKLKLHGIEFSLLKAAKKNFALETFRSEDPHFADKPFEGRQTLKVAGSWTSEARDLMQGALFIPINQPKAVLIADLLEPASEDSFLQWGFFNARFEQKEYMENYVAEDVAVEMLKDPKIRQEFSEKLKDEKFANSPEKRLEFFYRKHPAWDEHFGLYPIYKLDRSPLLTADK